MDSGEAPTLAFLRYPVVWAVTGIRFLAALYILVNPLWGFIWSAIFDILDAQVLIHFLGIKRSEYHLWDKNVDWLAYITEFLVAIQYGLYLPFFLLLFWRFAGQFMYMRTEKTVYFALFPNFFEVAFLWLVVFHPTINLFDFTTPHPWEWLIVFCGIKILQELSLHYIWPKYNLPHLEDTVKRYLNLIRRSIPH